MKYREQRKADDAAFHGWLNYLTFNRLKTDEEDVKREYQSRSPRNEEDYR